MTTETSELSAEAQLALEEFQAMRESKMAYFEYLQAIEEKYKDGGKASDAEEKELGDLLLAHDKQVTAFNQAMEKIEDANDRIELIKRMQ